MCPVWQHARHWGRQSLSLSGRASKTSAEPLANLDTCQGRGPSLVSAPLTSLQTERRPGHTEATTHKLTEMYTRSGKYTVILVSSAHTGVIILLIVASHHKPGWNWAADEIPVSKTYVTCYPSMSSCPSEKRVVTEPFKTSICHQLTSMVCTTRYLQYGIFSFWRFLMCSILLYYNAICHLSDGDAIYQKKSMDACNSFKTSCYQPSHQIEKNAVFFFF